MGLLAHSVHISFTVVPSVIRVTLSKKLGALRRIGGGIFAHTGLFGDRFGVWGDARTDYNAQVHSI